MADLTISKLQKAVFGNKRVHWGHFANSGTGGEINTGLTKCEAIFLQHTGTAAVAESPVVNETLPCDGSAVTIVTTSAKPGIFMAIGY